MASALLIDFGGVLTTDIFVSFGDFSVASGLPREAIRDAFAGDEEARRLLVELETGRLPTADFDARFAALLGGRHGVEVASDGLTDRLAAGLRLDERMVEIASTVRAAGVPTVLVSNSMGYEAYGLLDLDSFFDGVVLSGRVGVRKPSRRIYAIGAELAGFDPAECLLLDDVELNLAGAARLGIAGVHHTDPELSAAALETHFGIPLATAAGRRTAAQR
jgi:putative hydrolase of the HAD superfamily